MEASLPDYIMQLERKLWVHQQASARFNPAALSSSCRV